MPRTTTAMFTSQKSMKQGKAPGEMPSTGSTGDCAGSTLASRTPSAGWGERQWGQVVKNATVQGLTPAPAGSALAS